MHYNEFADIYYLYKSLAECLLISLTMLYGAENEDQQVFFTAF